ncbi:hypothetical protein [Endozoicomonas sp. 8E]|uniref:hypothetical protein n=1 Tax=Endozoicomonas sp. 8E TaxID=3035692 RepID=UPI0029392338|nr:hypothetical protein [Endozoicomonas sp. 8E]WOG30156.1 hypothetical protein P6910_11035 [Endozoicomonas sp. 8E]
MKELRDYIMHSNVNMEGSGFFTATDNCPNNQAKERVTYQSHTLASVVPLVGSDLSGVSACQQTSIRLRKFSAYDRPVSHVFKHIQDVISKKYGITVGFNKDRLVFDLTKKINEEQDADLEAGEYHYLISSAFDGTDIPDLIRAERLIPIVLKGSSKNQLILEFKHFPEAYVHTLYGEETPLKTLSITPFYNPEALNDVDTSMLRLDMSDIGFTDGSPRYIFTTEIYPCICVAFFDKSQNKVLFSHFTGTDFLPENLSGVFDFCDEQKMKSLECHIFCGECRYLGQKYGFLDLIDFISAKGVPIKQMFVGDSKDRPKSVVIDTRDMSLYGLPFSDLAFPASGHDMYVSKKKLRRIAKMPLITKNHSLSLFTAGLDA